MTSDHRSFIADLKKVELNSKSQKFGGHFKLLPYERCERKNHIAEPFFNALW